MLSFQALKKKVKGIDVSAFKQVNVALLGNHSTQFLAKAIEYSGKLNGLDIKVYNADYDQIESEVLNPESRLYQTPFDFIFISRSCIKLRNKFYSTDSAQKNDFAMHYIQELEMLVRTITAKSPQSKVICNNFEVLEDGVYGSLFSKTNESFTGVVYEINQELNKLSTLYENLYITDLNSLISYYGSKNVRDWSLYTNADIHYSLDFQAEIANKITQLIAAFSGYFKKCLILDLDNTTWGGVIGDDGMEGIQIGDLGIGKSFTELQTWAKVLKERGIILAVCSKNTEEIAKEPFEKHPEMVLRLDDIAVFVANWNNKADNIRYIKEVLNIGFDSMVFLDDNPAEREIIRQNIPEVTVPELPEDPAYYLEYLQNLNLFETASYSTLDRDRTKQYQQEAERKKLEVSLTNMDDYLASLDMRGKVEQFKEIDFPRIAQLSQRSNQFNLRTIRYSDTDIRNIANNLHYRTYSVKLKDKFGDYGLISMVIIKINGNEAFIDSWIMSCRVIKRDVERFVLNNIVNNLKDEGITKLIGEYLPTPKNGLVKEHYKNLGFVEDKDKWVLDLTQYKEFKTYIKAD